MIWPLNFITEDDFTKHVELTISQYADKLQPYNLEKLNKNIIDPIKLIFDKEVYHYSWDEIIKNEIMRQRDKSNNNDIGYFHQRIFQYIANCSIPQSGWDIIFRPEGPITLPDGEKVAVAYAELKNKHNTMSGSAGSDTYKKMQAQLLRDDDSVCYLVQVISKHSQDKPWIKTIDGIKNQHKRIRQISIDRFYALVTGQEDAFYQICMMLPQVIRKVVAEGSAVSTPRDTAVTELSSLAKRENGSIDLALYQLGFKDYLGFDHQ